MLNKYWFDEIYESLVRKPLDRMSSFFARVVEPKMIDGVVEGSGSFTRNLGSQLRKLQNGTMYIYIAAMVIGLIVMLIWKI
jgi:NADH-quinone oxidoreductase subunit L